MSFMYTIAVGHLTFKMAFMTRPGHVYLLKQIYYQTIE